MKYLLLFHCNNGCRNAPHCYVIRTLPVWLVLVIVLLYRQCKRYSIFCVSWTPISTTGRDFPRAVYPFICLHSFFFNRNELSLNILDHFLVVAVVSLDRWQRHRQPAVSISPCQCQCYQSLLRTYFSYKNSVALVRKRTIPTERPPPVGEVSTNFCAQRCVTWSAQRIPRPLISVFWTGAATFYSSSSSIDLTRLSGPRSRPTTTQKIWQRRESNPRPLYLQPETLTTRPQRRSPVHDTHNKTFK